MNNWVKEMVSQFKENEKLLAQITKDLKSLPAGELRISHHKGVARFYQTKGQPGGKDIYLGSKKTDLREALAQKRYVMAVKAALENEQEVIRQTLQKEAVSVRDVYKQQPKEVQEMVEPYILEDAEYARCWKEKYSQEASGEPLRSRIEIIINGIYENLDIPHVYEPSLYLQGFGPVRPDFAVLNMRTRQTLFHEHLGMMDDYDYRIHNLKKLRAYHNNGYYEGVNLILTMESDGKMIDYDELVHLIHFYCK